MRKPHLRLAVMNDCNLSCIYCRAGGEGVICNEVMSKDEIMKALRIAGQAGYSYLKVTGGEPLLREEIYQDLFDIISSVAKEKLFAGIGMVTNGLLLKKYAEKTVNSGIDSLTVSLDTADKDLYKFITGGDCFCEVIDGIKAVKSMGMKVNINAVISNLNIDGVPALIDLAKTLGVDLKLIDYVEFGSTTDGNETKQLHYVPFDRIYNYLEENFTDISKEMEFPYGGLGTPMAVYTFSDECKLYIKDATVGTNYNEGCKQCDNYPCQDALISMRITADGQLKKCLIRDDNLVPFLDDIRCGRMEEVERKISSSWGELIDTEYCPGIWRSKS